MYGKTYARPFIPLLISLIFGIIACLYFPDHRISAYIVISVCFIFILYRIISDNSKPHKFVKNVFLSPLLLFFALGYLSLQPYVAPMFPQDHIIHFADDNKWLITGIIDEKPVKDKDRISFVLQAEKLGRKTHVTGKIRVTASENIPELSLGDRISFVSMIKSIRNFNNPGGFDYQQYMAFQKIWVSASVKTDYPIYILEKNSEKRVIDDFRDNISKLIDETGPGDHVGVLKALIIGDNNEISESVRQDFNQAGIAHILSISGFHLDILGYILFYILRYLLFLSKTIRWNAWIKKIAITSSLIPVIGYGYFSGMSIPTQRAVIMFAMSTITLLYEKEHDSMYNLIIAAMIILIIYPHALFSVSFQLSFLGVFSMLYGSPKIHYKLNPLVRLLFSFFSVTLFAIFGTTPFIMLYYKNVTLIGLFSNFIFVPIICFIVIPLGLFSMLLYMISSQAASWCINASAFILANTLEIVTPTYLEILILYLLGWAILNIMRIQPDKDTDNKNNKELVFEEPQDFERLTYLIFKLYHNIRSRIIEFKQLLKETINSIFIPISYDKKDKFKRNLAKIVLVILTIISICDIAYWINYRFFHNDLRITMIDVGQGSSALVEIPGGACFLIDGGGSPDDSDFDVGEKIVMPFLLKKRIKTLDAVILSHPDSDHLNGLIYILKNLNVKEVWSNHDTTEEKSYKEFTEIINKKSIPHLKSGDLPAKEINGVNIEVLYPPADYMNKKETWRKKPNNNSLVVKITFGDCSFLFPGDIEAEAEAELVGIAGDKLKSTVLIAPHHGSKTSSTQEFLYKVKPEYVIVSAGWKNSFNLPHPSVTKRYTERECQIFRTDENGAIHITSDGKTLNIKAYNDK